MTQGVGSAVKFARARDLPDVLGFEDLAADPDGTFEVVRSRLDRGVAFTDSGLFPLPKGDGKSTRSMTVMNPFDEMGMRAYVGRCAPSIVAATDRTQVLNGLIERPGPGWFSADFVEQHKKRSMLRREYYDREHTGAVGFFDVSDFFASCAHGTVGSLLDAAGAPSGAVCVLTEMLATIFPSGVGLPIGFEGSGPIANLFFGRIDRELALRGIPFVRWTDDLDTFLREVEDWSEVHGLVEKLLLDVGLRLNEGKTRVIEKGPQAEGRLFDPSRDSVFGEDDPVAAADDRFEAEMWMSDFGFDGDAPAPAVRTWLRLAGRGPSMKAFEFLQAKPHWLDREPRAVGDYLVRVCQDSSTRGQVDLDWLMERAVGRNPTQQTAAGQLHACRALASYRVGKAKGKALSHFAWEQAERGRFMTLGAWSVQAWAQGQGWKPKVATDLIHTLDHHSYRRAAVAGFKHRMTRGDALKHLEPIRRRHPEIGPTVAYAISR